MGRYPNLEAAICDVSKILTGVVWALDLCAERDPDEEQARMTRKDVEDVRSARDGLLEFGAHSREHYSADYGGAEEFVYALLRRINPELRDRLLEGPSRSPWDPALKEEEK